MIRGDNREDEDHCVPNCSLRWQEAHSLCFGGRKRPIPKIEKQFEGKLVIKWNGSVWMNDATTSDFLMTIIDSASQLSQRLTLPIIPKC
uniref:DDE-1 domain-containing protein n=1 Tax=Ditylenchus dipsaci TaxID=166011 RepID=A0A915DBB3_9BILA